MGMRGNVRMRVRGIAAAGVGLTMILAACGSDNSGSSSSATTAGGATTTKASTASSAATTAAATTAGATTTAAGGAATSAAGGGTAAGCTVGVSWNNYQEERWAKWDEPAIKAAVEAGGGKYISNDAKSSAET